MNEDTLVSVHCYQGDAHQVQGSMPAYTHHGCPVVIVSPTDSPVVLNHPGVENIHSGLVGYIGQISLDRQLAQMKRLLDYPSKFFLMNDSDSIVLDPEIPSYLYEEDVVWSNVVIDNVPNREPFPDGWPHVAFQPPYFVSRSTLEKLVEAGESGHPDVVATHSRPYIDFYMLQLAMVAKLPWDRMRTAVSFPITINKVAHPNPTRAQLLMYEHGFRLAMQRVRLEGANILHSVKDGDATREFIEARKLYLAENPGVYAETRSPVVGGGNDQSARISARASLQRQHLALASLRQQRMNAAHVIGGKA